MTRFKSRRGQPVDTAALRQRQAAAVLAHVDCRRPAEPVFVVAGDFNTPPAGAHMLLLSDRMSDHLPLILSLAARG